VTFLTFEAADILYSNTVHFTAIDIIMEFFVNAIEFVAGAVVVIEIHLGLAVTVHAPAHALFSHLFYFIHLLDVSMAGLALHFSCIDVLGMVKIDKVGKVMDLNPLR
jgi:hypothetical protein